ncbi:MAG: 50S ribosomal protein L10 [Sedimentisphaeraceae bacterium JB056]
MSKFVKELLQKEFETLFGDTNEFVVIDTDGVGGNDNNMMRGELSNKGIRLRVVRNSLMRKAMDDLDMPTAKDLFTDGPCTVAFGGDSVVDVAKEVVDWAKKIKAIELKGAYVDGELVLGKGVVDLSKMPNRAELQAQVVQIALTPGSNIAGAVTSPASNIAGCLKTIIDKGEEAA